MTAPTTDTLLAIEQLRIEFVSSDSARIEAVKGVSFRIAPKQTLALVGESGSGKSVTAVSILGLLPRTARVSAESRILYKDRDLLKIDATELRSLRGKDISMVFQDPMCSLNPVFTVGEQIAESLRLHLKFGARQAQARAIELLNEVGIPRPELRVHSYPHELSGGQQQRAMIALAIACEPKLLIADEPTTALDVTVQKQILELLASLRARHGMSMLFITHDLSLVSEIADEVVVMQTGEIREQGARTTVFAAPQHPYTRALLACRPRLDWNPHRLPVVADFLDASRRLGCSPPSGISKRHEAKTQHLKDAEMSPHPTNPNPEIILQTESLSKTFRIKTALFRHEDIAAVADVSFQLPRGKTLGIVGESGSGKTTTALMLLRLQTASAGKVLFQGKDLLSLTDREMHAYRRRIQIVFQNPYASLNPRFTVAHLLLEPMKIHGIGANTHERLTRARDLLKRVGLPGNALHRYPHEFSGGQRQRIAIARCLAVQPEILICDEAVSALDVSVQAQVLNLLQDLQDEFALSYIFISHDLPVVKYISDIVLVMHQGRVVECAESEQLYRAPQAEYTKQLLNAIPGSRKLQNFL